MVPSILDIDPHRVQMFAQVPVTILPILAALVTLLIGVKLVHDELHCGPGQGVAGKGVTRTSSHDPDSKAWRS